MIGFRAELLTQDAMKVIKHVIEEIVDGRSREVKALLGLDLEKVFENVLYTFIVQTISDLDPGSRFYSYVSSFLSDRKDKLRIVDFRSEDVPLGGRGPLQDAVISPTLFNICINGHSERLAHVQDVKHAI
ncbi:uncharacterized protein [Dermacentor andersoni]|uniref:uncharacterized protein n=1 Tax=Dermacentor andersoni TaxID=34620 RepID=UPI003B3A0647